MAAIQTSVVEEQRPAPRRLVREHPLRSEAHALKVLAVIDGSERSGSVLDYLTGPALRHAALEVVLLNLQPEPEAGRLRGYGSFKREAIEDRLERLALPRELQTRLAPLRTELAALTQLIVAADAAVATAAKADAVATQLMTAPGVGPVVALTFQATLDDPSRFAGDAGRASAFLGLVPSEDSSAERRLKARVRVRRRSGASADCSVEPTHRRPGRVGASATHAGPVRTGACYGRLASIGAVVASRTLSTRASRAVSTAPIDATMTAPIADH